MTITLTLSRNQTQLDCLATQLEVVASPTQLLYEGSLGKLIVEGHYFAQDLWVHTYDSTLNQPVPLHTLNPADSALYCLFINLSEQSLNKHIGAETVQVSQHAPAGILYYGPGLRIEQLVPAAIRFRAVCLTFSLQTIQTLLPAHTADDLLPPPAGFVFLDLDHDTEHLLRQFLQPTDPGPLTGLRYYGRSLEFLAQVFAKMGNRPVRNSTAGLLQPDLARLFEARRLLLTQFIQPPTHAELARSVGLSEATLRRYFPRLFGMPMYQYVQATRMQQARKLLATRQFNVSEVGFRVGYTNLTHFTNAYKKHFGHKPSEYLKEITSG
jgi:AraC-like DNA-binding protein